MNKKLIIIIIVLGLAGFAGMFAVAWLTQKSPEPQVAKAEQTEPEQQEGELNLTEPQVPVNSEVAKVNGGTETVIADKQLKSLVYEVREKIQEYSLRLNAVEVREQRLQTAQEMLKKDIDQLNELRIELASTVARLKSEQDKLLKTRIKVDETEKNNLISIAATYDKMDSTSAGEILSNMVQVKNSGSDDAVKILHYMSERSKAKVLASIAETEPAVSAYFCQKLKQIMEGIN